MPEDLDLTDDGVSPKAPIGYMPSLESIINPVPPEITVATAMLAPAEASWYWTSSFYQPTQSDRILQEEIDKMIRPKTAALNNSTKRVGPIDSKTSTYPLSPGSALRMKNLLAAVNARPVVPDDDDVDELFDDVHRTRPNAQSKPSTPLPKHAPSKPFRRYVDATMDTASLIAPIATNPLPTALKSTTPKSVKMTSPRRPRSGRPINTKLAARRPTPAGTPSPTGTKGYASVGLKVKRSKPVTTKVVTPARAAVSRAAKKPAKVTSPEKTTKASAPKGSIRKTTTGRVSKATPARAAEAKTTKSKPKSTTTVAERTRANAMNTTPKPKTPSTPTPEKPILKTNAAKVTTPDSASSNRRVLSGILLPTPPATPSHSPSTPLKRKARATTPSPEPASTPSAPKKPRITKPLRPKLNTTHSLLPSPPLSSASATLTPSSPSAAAEAQLDRTRTRTQRNSGKKAKKHVPTPDKTYVDSPISASQEPKSPYLPRAPGRYPLGHPKGAYHLEKEELGRLSTPRSPWPDRLGRYRAEVEGVEEGRGEDVGVETDGEGFEGVGGVSGAVGARAEGGRTEGAKTKGATKKTAVKKSTTKETAPQKPATKTATKSALEKTWSPVQAAKITKQKAKPKKNTKGTTKSTKVESDVAVIDTESSGTRSGWKYLLET